MTDTEIDINTLKAEDRIALRLNALYKSYGYCEYRLNGFEDYSLYSDNVSFLDGSGVMTFNMGGKIFALRPDVTLSVVKNVSVDGDVSKKLFYDERVYRKAAGSGDFSELRQIGVEVLGNVDSVTEAEVFDLVLATLSVISDDFLLGLSHAGIIEKILLGMNLDGDGKRMALRCLSSKNTHDFDVLNYRGDIDGDYADSFKKLIALPATPAEALSVLRGISDRVCISEEINELERTVSMCGGRVNIDFSIGGDVEYYNGVVFKGYVRGVPYAVISGGRYDRLLAKFKKQHVKAIGFALYLGELNGYFKDNAYVPEIAVVYTDDTARSALDIARGLRVEGKSVMMCRRVGNFRGKVIYAGDKANV